MKKIQRVSAAIMAAVIISTTAYNISIPVNAAGIVAGGLVGEALIEWLIAVGIVGLASYCGYEIAEEYQERTVRNYMEEFLATTEGSSALQDYYGQTQLYVINGGGGDPEPPEPNKNDDDILDTKLYGIAGDIALFEFISKFYNYLSSTSLNSRLSADALYRYAELPDNVYIGYDSASVPDNLFPTDSYPYIYNRAHVQCSDGNFYYDTQGVPNNDGSCGFVNVNGQTNITIGASRYRIVPSNSLIQWVQSANPSYENFSSSSVTSFVNNSTIKLTHYDYIYAFGTEDFPILIKNGTTINFLAIGNSLYMGNTLTLCDPVSLYTPSGALNNIKPVIGGKSVAQYNNAIGQKLNPDPASDPVVFSSEAINNMYNNAYNYYNNVANNYYSNPNYITENEYITNVTNIYEQAAEESPASPVLPEAPSLDLSGILSAILSIPRTLINLLSELLQFLFIPNVDLMNELFLSFGDHFTWVRYFWNIGMDIFNILFDSDPEIPVIIIDFNLAESKYNYGGRTYALDMTWYSRYKPQIDNIIVSISWLCFIYWLIKNLPQIIEGSPVTGRAQAEIREMDHRGFHID